MREKKCSGKAYYVRVGTHCQFIVECCSWKRMIFYRNHSHEISFHFPKSHETLPPPPPLPPSIYRCSFLLECPQEALFLFSHLPSIQNSLISLHICVIWNLRIKNNPPSLLVSLTVRTRLPLRKISYSNTMKPFFWKASPNKIQA